MESVRSSNENPAYPYLKYTTTVKKPSVFFTQSVSTQPADTGKTDTDGGIRFKHLGVSKAWNVLACCDTMIDGRKRRPRV